VTDLRQLAVATDTELTDLYTQAWAIRDDIAFTERNLLNIQKWRGHDWEGQTARWEARLAALNEQLEPIQRRIGELDAVWQQYRWARFFLVLNNNGHIHKTMRCPTCYDTTRFAWLPKLAAMTETEAVAQEGAILCTICFPTAPVEWTNGVGTRTAQTRDAKQAAKDARLAAKRAKWLTDNEKGLTVTTEGGFTERLTTLAAARQWLTAAILETLPAPWKTLAGWGATAKPENVAKVAAAIAAKEGKTADEVLTEATERATKKMRTEIRAYERRTVLT
jgi:hypothetical protein